MNLSSCHVAPGSKPYFLTSQFIQSANDISYWNNCWNRYIEQKCLSLQSHFSTRLPLSVRCGWRRKDTMNIAGRSKNLIAILQRTSDVKEELYAALDLWCGFQIEFPMLALKTTLVELRRRKNYKRIIQVSKWMLSKGQGQTIGTYSMMIEAYNELKRYEEMEDLWKSVLTKYLDAIPKSLIKKMMQIHAKEGRHLKILEIYGSMEGIGIKPDEDMVNLISAAFVNVGAEEYAIEFEKNYPLKSSEWRYRNGKKVRVRVSAPQSSVLFPILADSESPKLELEENVGRESEENSDNSSTYQ